MLQQGRIEVEEQSQYDILMAVAYFSRREVALVAKLMPISLRSVTRISGDNSALMMAEGKAKPYDVFLVHCTDDKEIAIQKKSALSGKGLNVYAHYDEGSKFDIGKPTLDSIEQAINMSNRVLILLTPNAIKSQWVTLEILLSLERSHREGSMCCRLCMVGISEVERQQYQTGELKHIPSVMVDFNREDWVKRLYDNIIEEKHMKDILPAGNVAVGLVFNYFVGFLHHILPNLKEAIEASDIYKTSSGKVSRKLFMLLPSSCVAPKIEGGGEVGKPLVEKEGSLKIEAGHGDKKRQYNPAIYSVRIEDEKWYFVGECPTIIETMSKIYKHGFLDIDIYMQVNRFRITLQELVQHRQNKVCNDSVAFISYDDTEKSAQEMVYETMMTENLQELRMSEQVGSKLLRHVSPHSPKKRKLTSVPESPEKEEYFASVTHTDVETDQAEAFLIMGFLGKQGKTFTNGDPNRLTFEVLERSRWNIFIFSKASLADPQFKLQFDSAINASINDDQLQVIPVMTTGLKIEDVPIHYRWVTLLSADEPDHVEKIWKVMTGPVTKMTEKIPAGEVYKGLAWAYLLNYLPLALLGTTVESRNFEQRFEDAMKKYKIDCPCVAKVFIIIPKSCSCPSPGSYFEGEEHIGPLEPVVLGFRKFFLQMYKITTSKGEIYCYAREYATPVIAMHDMANTYPFAGLSKEALFKQTELFTQYMKEEIAKKKFKEEIGDLENRVRLVNYDDMTEVAGKRMSMVEALETEIYACLETERPLQIAATP